LADGDDRIELKELGQCQLEFDPLHQVQAGPFRKEDAMYWLCDRE